MMLYVHKNSMVGTEGKGEGGKRAQIHLLVHPALSSELCMKSLIQLYNTLTSHHRTDNPHNQLDVENFDVDVLSLIVVQVTALFFCCFVFLLLLLLLLLFVFVFFPPEIEQQLLFLFCFFPPEIEQQLFPDRRCFIFGGCGMCLCHC